MHNSNSDPPKANVKLLDSDQGFPNKARKPNPQSLDKQLSDDNETTISTAHNRFNMDKPPSLFLSKELQRYNVEQKGVLKPMSGSLNTLLKSKLVQSKSSLSSHTSTEISFNRSINMPNSLKRVTLEELADTSSENEEEYAKSVHSIISDYLEDKNRDSFIFNEEFESSSRSGNSITPKDTTLENTHNLGRHDSKDAINMPDTILTNKSSDMSGLRNRNNQNDDSIRSSSKTRIRKRKHLSTSTKIEHNNDLEDLNVIDFDLPNPDISDSLLISKEENRHGAKQEKTVGFLEDNETALNPTLHIYSLNSQAMEETILREPDTTKRSSLSSGELLSKLANSFIEEEIHDLVEERYVYQVANKNLTGRVGSDTKLPVMLYKIEDRESRNQTEDSNVKRMLENATFEDVSKDSDSSESFKSTHTDFNSNQKENPFRSRNTESVAFSIPLKLSHVQAEPEGEFGTVSLAHKAEIKKNGNEAINLPPGRVAVDLKKPNKNNHLQDTISKQNSHENMLNDPPPWNTLDPSDLEKSNLPAKRSHDNIDSCLWLIFAVLLVFGLVAPPVYFLIPLGFFDRSNALRCHGHINLAYPQDSFPKTSANRFTALQKIISLVWGLTWLLIVLAMIAVGLSVGITRE